jgi:mRNA-degrading endonuclease RelE of RelBE toxin-antitoxin system
VITVAETPTFTRQAEKLFSPAELEDLLVFLASNPTAGDIIPGTGGVRKVRYQASGRGKRGGARVIYFYFDDDYPLIALTLYAKNEREDLTPEGKRMISQIAEAIKAEARKRK